MRFKIILFFCLTGLPLLVGKFIIPLDFFAFRVHEILDDQRQYLSIRGPYYPNQHLQKTEEGDIGRRTPYAVKKSAEWFTDEFGFRNRSSAPTEIVIVGRSESTGLSLSQEDRLSDTLQRKLGVSVYAYAPKDFPEFLKEKRFKTDIPKTVIVTLTERELHSLLPLKEWDKPSEVEKRPWQRLLPPAAQIYWDQMLKKPILTHYVLKSLLYERFKVPEAIDPKNRMLFFLYALYKITGYQSSDSLMGEIVNNLKEYQIEAERRGIRFIFMPVPTKENICWDRIPEASKKEYEKPVFTARLIKELRKNHIDVVDLEPLFVESKNKGEVLFQLDDTHWNPKAVLIAVDAIEEVLKNPIDI